MTWWCLTNGLLALLIAAGHALAGRHMYFRPIKALLDAEHSAIFSGMWHLITLHFAVSSLSPIYCGIRTWNGPVASR